MRRKKTKTGWVGPNRKRQEDQHFNHMRCFQKLQSFLTELLKVGLLSSEELSGEHNFASANLLNGDLSGR